MKNNYGFFTNFIDYCQHAGELIVQPRMGFSEVSKMKKGLSAVAKCNAVTIGTITLDSYTRVGDLLSVKSALENKEDLNGYPIINHGPEKTNQMLNGILSSSFPVQVRHGSALPENIFSATLSAGIDAIEGGPISYCLPYSRVALSNSIKAWEKCCQLLANEKLNGTICHLESFAGCMLGQLCPPSLLIALGILEGIFFKKNGIISISLSYAQGTNIQQDAAAILALKKLIPEYLVGVKTHVVVYTFMGVFPKTVNGAFNILRDSAWLAATIKAERLIVKTPVEAFRIPTVEENTAALEFAYISSKKIIKEILISEKSKNLIYQQAKCFIEVVLGLHKNINQAFLTAFNKGYLDVPYCLHSDNNNKSRTYIDDDGCLQWAYLGNIPLPSELLESTLSRKEKSTSNELLKMLSYNQNRYDNNAGIFKEKSNETYI